jgi:hypothetical protein
MDIERGGILSSTPCLNTSALSVTEITSPSSCTLNHRFSFFPPLPTIKSQIIIYEKKREMKKNPTQMDSIEKEEKTLSQIDCCQREEVYLYGGCVRVC